MSESILDILDSFYRSLEIVYLFPEDEDKFVQDNSNYSNTYRVVTSYSKYMVSAIILSLTDRVYYFYTLDPFSLVDELNYIGDNGEGLFNHKSLVAQGHNLFMAHRMDYNYA